jgi:dolichol-phosphate mannosyltransferase
LESLEHADIAIGSRYAAGGDGAALGYRREAGSRLATMLSRLVLRQPVDDPMSGFFAMRRDSFDAVASRLSGVGFKILLDILTSANSPLKIVEWPYRFRRRESGESKLGTAVVTEYLLLLVEKVTRGLVPARFVLFAGVGGTGVAVHLAALKVGLHSSLSFPVAQAFATLVAMTSNFFLNNTLTYADRRRRGWEVVSGLATFYAICAVGAVANVGIASTLFDRWPGWWQAGLAGALVGVVWNYAVSSVYTWKR